MKTKVKVIELEGQKLDPKAKYIFVVNLNLVILEEMRELYESLGNLIGDKFVITHVHGNPSEALKIYEVKK